MSKSKVGTQYAAAQQSHLLRLTHGGASPFYGAVMAVAYKDIAVGGAGGVTGQNHPFDQGVGVALQNALVVVGAGVALLAVAQDVLDGGV